LAIALSILFDRLRWEEKALYKAAKRKKLSTKLIDIKNIYFDTLSKKRAGIFGDISIQRCISYFRGLHLTAILEKMAIPVINPFHVSMTCGNKLLTTLALSKANVPTPKTYVTFTRGAAVELTRKIGYPAVLKPVVGSWGRLISPLKDEESAEAFFEHREHMSDPLLQIFYIQEMVDRPPRDVRTIVVGEEIIAAVYRSSPTGEWRTNVALGAITSPCPITRELEHAVLRAAEAVGGGVLGVDCMESSKGILVHEVNSTVEFKGAAAASKVNIPEKIVSYAIEKVKR